MNLKLPNIRKKIEALSLHNSGPDANLYELVTFICFCKISMKPQDAREYINRVIACLLPWNQ